ncbi:MAG: tRNA (cytidine(34)-2'-O)-methyltransferase [Burkholderiaceae bacterium]
MIHVVLVHPEIPPNTGNVIRLCANAGAGLHLVRPLGFELDDARLRRAGLDYHEFATVRVHDDWASCRAAAATDARWFALTTRADARMHDTRFRAGDYLVFGCETSGLPAPVLASFAPEHRLRLPMRAGNRSLNLSNAVAVTVYEAWRQLGFAGAG